MQHRHYEELAADGVKPRDNRRAGEQERVQASHQHPAKPGRPSRKARTKHIGAVALIKVAQVETLLREILTLCQIGAKASGGATSHYPTIGDQRLVSLDYLNEALEQAATNGRARGLCSAAHAITLLVERIPASVATLPNSAITGRRVGRPAKPGSKAWLRQQQEAAAAIDAVITP